MRSKIKQLVSWEEMLCALTEDNQIYYWECDLSTLGQNINKRAGGRWVLLPDKEQE